MDFTEKDFDKFKLKVIKPGYLFKIDDTDLYLFVVSNNKKTNSFIAILSRLGFSDNVPNVILAFKDEYNGNGNFKATLFLDMVVKLSTDIYNKLTYKGTIIDNKTMFAMGKYINKPRTPVDFNRHKEFLKLIKSIESYIKE